MSTRNRYYGGPTSDHFDGLRFFNPGQPETDRSLRDLWRWRAERAAVRWPAHVAVTPNVPESRVEQMRITMVGHATLLIQVAGLNILTDPVWSDRISPVKFAGPRRLRERMR
ncbi:MAG TPA: hypothetical protein VNO35_26345 [Steroidobacteraceae bacterium]|nr:hypothetical protein [Steroidobacteraceae bacterium]